MKPKGTTTITGMPPARGGHLSRAQIEAVVRERRRPGVIRALALKYRCSEELITFTRRHLKRFVDLPEYF